MGADARGEQARPKWKHRRGDRYMPVFGDWFGNPERGYRHEWSSLDDFHPTLSGAKRAGFKAQDSDDFNIAVVRGGALVALLWMDEDMQEDRDVLAALWPTVEGYL